METLKASATLTPYPTRLIVYVTSNPAQVMKTVNSQFKESFEFGPDFRAVTLNVKKTIKGFERDYAIIVLHANDLDPAVIAHEAVHASNYAFMHAGVDLDAENDEPQAYMVGRIVQLVYKVIKKYEMAKQIN